MDLLTVKDLSVDLGNFSLKNVSFGVPEGSYCCLLGASGAGKSVLLETIIGGFRPRRGKVFLRGEDVTSWPPERRRLGIVYQDYMLFPHLDVYRNIAFGLVGKGLSGEEIRSRVESISDHLDIADLMQRDIATLSGGEQQRVTIAQAMLLKRDLYLLDEVTSSLDQANIMRVIDLFTGSADRTVIAVSHNHEWRGEGMRVFALQNGHLQEEGERA